MRRHLIAAAAFASPLLALVAPSGAAFSPPQPLFRDGWIAAKATTQLSDGSAFAVAQLVDRSGFSRLQLAWRPAGGAFAPPVRLSRGGNVGFRGGLGVNAGQTGLAATAAGFATIAWAEHGTVMTVSRRPDGMQEQPRALAPGVGAIAATTPSGDALVVFRAADGALRAAVRPHDADRFGAPRTLAAYVRDLDTFELRARDDDFLLLWSGCATRRRQALCPRFRTSAAVIGADGRAAATRTLSLAPVLADRLLLLVGASGDALALWSPVDGDDPVRIARATAGARGFSRSHTISRRRSAASSVAAATGTTGGFAAWIERDDDGDSRVVGADLRWSGAVGPPIELSRAHDEITQPTVRVGDDGSVAVAWQPERRASLQPATWRLRSRQRGGVFSAAAKLTAVEQLDVAVDPDGAVIALVRVTQRPEDPGPACASTSDLLSGVWRAGTKPLLQPLDRCVVDVSPMLAVNAAGNALAVWTRDLDSAPPDRWLRYATRPRGGRFGSVETADGAGATFAETALAANGDAITIVNDGVNAGPPLLATFADDLFADG